MNFTDIELPQRLLKSRILVVDDTEFNRVIIEEVLAAAGFTQIAMAGNGIEALASCSASMPDIIILDLMMPEMDGFEFCTEFRKNPATSSIPIIVQTAMSSVDERLKIFQHGANDLVLKPINPLELISRIKLHLTSEYALKDLARFHARVNEELALASEMQMALLPTAEHQAALAASHGLTVNSFSQPSSELGGDLWGIEPISPHQVAVYMFDIAGHGVNAAINAFRIHSLLHLKSLRTHSPAEYLSILNNRLCDLFHPGQFATFMLGVINTQTNSMDFAMAASTSPLLMQHNARPMWLDAEGFPVGILRDAHFSEQSVKFSSGDTLLLYSDALTESPQTQNAEFLENAAIETIMQKHLKSTAAPVHQLQQRALAETLGLLGVDAGTALRDDLTIALITRQ